MAKYYSVKNSEGRFLKFRTGNNGSKHAWVNNLRSASYGTEAQMQAAIEEMKNSPFYPDLQLHYLGEAASGWMAKMEAVKNQ